MAMNLIGRARIRRASLYCLLCNTVHTENLIVNAHSGPYCIFIELFATFCVHVYNSMARTLGKPRVAVG
jgi:hypothetical protein